MIAVGTAAIAARGRFLIALSGGSTPRSLYTRLASPDCADRLDWSRVQVLFGDERAVPPTHADSNFAMADQTLFTPLRLAPAQIHRMRGEDEPEAAAAQYENTLRRFTAGGGGAWPILDLVLLGMGEDGHTASLFPNGPELHERTRWVTPSYSPQGTRTRLTLTLGVINRASVVLFLVAGANKATVVRHLLEPQTDDAVRYPAALVQPVAGQLVWYLDQAAAAKLTRSQQTCHPERTK